MRKIWNIISGVLVGIVVVLAVLLVGVRFIGLQNYTVLSGSMEPAYPTGSMIYIKQTDPQKLEVGDVITFRISGETIATHRIIEEVQEGGTTCFRTKGDANEVDDNVLVQPDNILGKVLFCIPGLGFLAAYLQSASGRYAAIAVGALILLVVFVPDLLFPGKKEKENVK